MNCDDLKLDVAGIMPIEFGFAASFQNGLDIGYFQVSKLSRYINIYIYLYIHIYIHWISQILCSEYITLCSMIFPLR